MTALCPSSFEKYFSPLVTLTGHFPMSIYHSHTGKHRIGSSSPDMASPVSIIRKRSPPSTFWQFFFSRSPGCLRLSLLQGCLSLHGQLPVHQDPDFPLSKSTFQVFIPQHIQLPRFIPSQMQEFIFPSVELRKIRLSPFIQPVKVPLKGSTTLWCVSHSSQFHIIYELAESALCPSLRVINEDVEQY